MLRTAMRTDADGGQRHSDHWHLRKANWLSTLAPDIAASVRRTSKRREYVRGENIFHPIREPRHVYLLEEGLVRIFRLSPAGDELTIGYVRPGEIFGEVSIITERARSSFAQAARDSKILEIPKNVFLKALRSSKPLYEITKRIGIRLITCQSRAEDLVFCNVSARLARLLLRLAEDLGRRTDQGFAIGLPLTGQEIATLIGTTRQTVSPALRDLVRAGVVVRRHGELVIADRPALHEVAKLSPQ